MITDIHPNDEMYLFFTTHPDHQNTPKESYFTSGREMLDDLKKMLALVGKSLEDTESFLEFACGYGRFTRHLIGSLENTKVTVSDVYEDAIDFQKTTFGVKAFHSNFDPSKVEMPRKYDVVFVASLFSHLPEKSWSSWLVKLYETLGDGGTLIFSVHGMSCMPDPSLMPDSGFYYLRMSESNSHPFDEYGTTYVASDFVSQVVQQDIGANSLLEIPKGLWNYQDVFILEKKIR